MSTITIACKDINKSFIQGDKKIEVLKGVDFVAHENELIFLMGPSGSGKSTLLSIIGGFLSQDSGECLILGKPMNQMAHKEKTDFRGKNIGFLLQSFNLIPTLSNIENVSLPLFLNGVERNAAFAQAEVMLDKMDLKPQIDTRPSNLSGGEQQRVAIARACIHKPKIILCDEPTSSLDLERGKKIMLLLQEIKKEMHCTIIVVTHDPRILPFADRIVKIEDGKIAGVS